MSKCKDIDSDALNADIVSDSSLALPNVVENIRVPIVKPVNFNNSTSFLNLAQASFEVPMYVLLCLCFKFSYSFCFD